MVNISQTLEEEYRNIAVKDVLTALLLRWDWLKTGTYTEMFKSSPYANYNASDCDPYTSLYKMLVMN